MNKELIINELKAKNQELLDVRDEKQSSVIYETIQRLEWKENSLIEDISHLINKL